ncbi:hypothetical protein ACTMTI_40780 [Nonomuraea sp. H19]|uniref:hypothetical protein n=1 Tax=Nonomuraea sp. H19 TaxID=3452206 RepID=UPI003F8C936E
MRFRRAGHVAPPLIALWLVVSGCGGMGQPSAGQSPLSSPAATPSATPSPPANAPQTVDPAPSTTETPAPSTTATSAPGTTATPAPGAQGQLVEGYYQPLWPFSTQEEAAAWQRAHRADGRAKWHLDPGRTAIAFARDFLGFTEIDRAVKTVRKGRHARIHLGYRSEEGQGVAAVVHLVRYGPGADAPWEVVGTDDTSLSLTIPKYGAAVRSPLTVGGRITGVDESIRIQVRVPGTDAALGERCCLPAGGDDEPWSAKVAFKAAPGRTLTIVASTGGHVATVERFAVTGVTVAP